MHSCTRACVRACVRASVRPCVRACTRARAREQSPTNHFNARAQRFVKRTSFCPQGTIWSTVTQKRSMPANGLTWLQKRRRAPRGLQCFARPIGVNMETWKLTTSPTRNCRARDSAYGCLCAKTQRRLPKRTFGRRTLFFVGTFGHCYIQQKFNHHTPECSAFYSTKRAPRLSRGASIISRPGSTEPR